MGFANLARATGETRGWASQSYPTRQGLRGKQKTQQSQRLLGFLELLTRFELVTRFTPKTLRVFGDPGQLDMGDAPAAPALSPKPPEGRGHRGKNRKPSSQKRLLGFLELLTRFELVTRFTPKTLCVFGGPVPNNMGLRPKPPPHPRRQDEVTEKQKTTASKLLTVVSGAANQI